MPSTGLCSWCRGFVEYRFGGRLRWQKLVDGSVAVAHVLSSPSHPTRLTLCERDLTNAAVDGVWWPKSLDLALELPDLVTVFNLRVGRVRRVVYDPTAWLPAPSRVIRRNEMVSLDPYRLVFSDTIYLKGTRSRDAVLFVLAPSSFRRGRATPATRGRRVSTTDECQLCYGNWSAEAPWIQGLRRSRRLPPTPARNGCRDARAAQRTVRPRERSRSRGGSSHRHHRRRTGRILGELGPHRPPSKGHDG